MHGQRHDCPGHLRERPDGNDVILCATVDADATVDGLGGDDTIAVAGSVNGTVSAGAGMDHLSVFASGSVSGVVVGDGGDGDGGDGDDHITVAGVVTSSGDILGGAGNDFLLVGVNNGLVNGGDSSDYCRVASGNGPVGFEYPL
ncbi:hypothetical protein [Streptomyces sp. NPDC018833]|uniref:hypothetical protein n=1 Tax=Streptomyces sp. NPDC018833 TaxID=3365053 RepID=UPI0037B1FF80